MKYGQSLLLEPSNHPLFEAMGCFPLAHVQLEIGMALQTQQCCHLFS